MGRTIYNSHHEGQPFGWANPSDSAILTLERSVQLPIMEVTDEAEMQRVIEAYGAKYGWPLTAREDGFYAPFAAPAAGPPPYLPYAVTPKVIFGMGTTNELAPHSTRYQF